MVSFWLAAVLVAAGIVLADQRRPALRVVCSSIEDLCREWARGYTRRTGTPVAMVRMSSGEALTRISRHRGEFDVWHGGPSDLYEVARARGQLVPHHSSGAAGVPPQFKAGDGSWTGVYRGVLGLCLNTRVLSRLGVPQPRTWDDLLDPRLRDQVSVPDPQSSGTGWTMLWTQRQRLGSDEAAMQYYLRLQPNVLQYTVSGVSPVGIVSRGEAAVAVSFTQHCVKAHDEGVPHLVVRVPSGLTGQEIGAVAILRGTHQLDRARGYIDWATSREAQELGTETRSLQLPTRTDAHADPRLGLPPDSRLVWSGHSQVDRARSRLTRLFVQRIRP